MAATPSSVPSPLTAAAAAVLLTSALARYEEPAVLVARARGGGPAGLATALLTQPRAAAAAVVVDGAAATVCSVAVHGLAPVAQRCVACATCAAPAVCAACAANCHVGHALIPASDDDAPLRLAACACGSARTTCCYFPPPGVSAVDARRGERRVAAAVTAYLLAPSIIDAALLPDFLRSVGDAHGYVPLPALLSKLRERCGGAPLRVPPTAVLRWLRSTPCLRVAKLGSRRPRCAPRHPQAEAVLRVALAPAIAAGTPPAALATRWPLGPLPADRVVDPAILAYIASCLSGGGGAPVNDLAAMFPAAATTVPPPSSVGSAAKRPRLEAMADAADAAPAPPLVAITTCDALSEWVAGVTAAGVAAVGLKVWHDTASPLDAAYKRIENARYGSGSGSGGCGSGSAAAAAGAASATATVLAAGSEPGVAFQRVHHALLVPVQRDAAASPPAILVDVDAVVASYRPGSAARRHLYRTVHVSPPCAAMSSDDMARAEALSPLACILEDVAILKVRAVLFNSFVTHCVTPPQFHPDHRLGCGCCAGYVGRRRRPHVAGRRSGAGGHQSGGWVCVGGRDCWRRARREGGRWRRGSCCHRRRRRSRCARAGIVCHHSCAGGIRRDHHRLAVSADI